MAFGEAKEEIFFKSISYQGQIGTSRQYREVMSSTVNKIEVPLCCSSIKTVYLTCSDELKALKTCFLQQLLTQTKVLHEDTVVFVLFSLDEQGHMTCHPIVSKGKSVNTRSEWPHWQARQKVIHIAHFRTLSLKTFRVLHSAVQMKNNEWKSVSEREVQTLHNFSPPHSCPIAVWSGHDCQTVSFGH